MAWVGATDAEEARTNLRASLRGPLPSVLERGDLPERATALLTYVWEETVRPDWERRLRVMEADMAARTAGVNQDGWAAVLDSLKPGTRWLGESRFQVNHNAYPPQELAAGAAVHAGHAEDQLGVVGGTGALRSRLPVSRGALRRP